MRLCARCLLSARALPTHAPPLPALPCAPGPTPPLLPPAPSYQLEAIAKVDQRRRELEAEQRRAAERRRLEVAQRVAAAHEAREGLPAAEPPPLAAVYGLSAAQQTRGGGVAGAALRPGPKARHAGATNRLPPAGRHAPRTNSRGGGKATDEQGPLHLPPLFM